MGLIEKKVGDFSLGEAFSVGISKTLTEQLLAPLIGNGNYMSGGVKLVGAWAIPKYLLKNKYGKVLGTALAVDGVEDVVNALFTDGKGNQQKESGLI